MCYGYGLRENELNSASPQFVSLFLQGQAEKDLAAYKVSWEQARFIASTMSKEASRVKFWWEKSHRPKVDIPQEVWDRFTLDLDGKKGSWNDYKPN
jgi:hypothetical protein